MERRYLESCFFIDCFGEDHVDDVDHIDDVDHGEEDPSPGIRDISATGLGNTTQTDISARFT